MELKVSSADCVQIDFHYREKKEQRVCFTSMIELKNLSRFGIQINGILSALGTV